MSTSFRVATLNLEQDHKCWDSRRELIVAQAAELKPDFFALNEIHVPSQTGRWLRRALAEKNGQQFSLVQQRKTSEDGREQAEGLLTRHAIVESDSLDYRSHDCVALVARFEIGGRLLDLYVTHLIAARVDESAREFQAEQLIAWTKTRSDADFSIVCGDFNAPLDAPSIRLMRSAFRPTQNEPTAFTPLQEPGGKPTHPEWPRFDRCIDYIWLSEGIAIKASGLCFDKPAADNPTLWPSDHVGVWADLELLESA
ncbi:MAG TPA: endonuclease/exonuclease/phosphatase family protein [Candidatus Binatia bacterium]|jgi:endonuclease/exonuclease/phosphatase family metal-dependent hydrolase